MSKDLLSKLLAGMAAALVAGVSHAGPIATRAELAGLLGGVGNLEHLYDGFVKAGASACLAASIFHYREYTIGEAKEYLKNRGVAVRV